MRIYPVNIGEKEAERLLKEEVLLSHAPVTGIFVASAIFTLESIYFEHNYERENPVFFEHSETRSLKEILQHEKKPKINMVMLAAGGNANKYKSYIPCYGCTVALSPYLTADAQVRLLGLPKVNSGLVFSYKELIESYKALPYSKIEGSDFFATRAQLIEKTALHGIDADFVAELALYGKDRDIGIYLTGSCTKRGGAGTLLNSKSKDKYRDIDIVIITKAGLKDIERCIGDLLIKHYKQFTKNDRIVPIHHNPNGVVIKKSYYHCGSNNKSTIDFTFSTDFKGTLAYHAYEVKNWFHQLS